MIGAIQSERLPFRESNILGNPWYRLLRQELESPAQSKIGLEHLHKKKLQKELSDFDSDARRTISRLKSIERRKVEWMKEANE